MKIVKPTDLLSAEIPFEHEDLTICVAANSKLLRTKFQQALSGRNVQVFETADMAQLEQFVANFQPKVVFLGFRFFKRTDFPGHLLELDLADRPRLILTGTQQELESDHRSKGVDALLCLPFMPESVLLKINSVLKPGRDWHAEEDLMLRKMRKYQRFSVSHVSLHILKPVSERTSVVDFSYQGLKIVSVDLLEEMVDQNCQMQMICEGVSIMIGARIMWVRPPHVGLRFERDRPGNFNTFFKKVIAGADEID